MTTIGTRTFPLSYRLWVVAVPLALLLAVSVQHNLSQSRIISEEQTRRLAAEREVENNAGEKAKQAMVLEKKNANRAGSDARFQELYREIDTLSRLNDRVLSQPQSRLRKSVVIDNPAETLSAP
jgi:hypothetical protein